MFFKGKTHKNIHDHMPKWLADPHLPPSHTPKFNAHLLKIIPRKVRARILRIYLRNISTGHYHRHAFPLTNICHFCLSPPPSTTPPHPETPLHLFVHCSTAQRVWQEVKRRAWLPHTTTPFPHDDWSLHTGDISHLPNFPLPLLWHILHASTVSRIYLARCRIVYNHTTNNNSIRIAAEIAAAIKTDIADAIRVSWKTTGAASDPTKLTKFKDLWEHPHLHNLITVSTIVNFDHINQEYGPGHGLNTLKIHI